MSVFLHAAATVAALALGPGWTAAPAQQPPTQPAPDVTRIGPRVGEKVPDFTLADQQGRKRNLASLMGEKGLVLVLSRSADW